MLKINIKKLPKSELEIEGEVEIDAFEAYFSKALKKIGEKLELPGFRKGKVPENVLLSNIPEAQILGEMAEMALSEYYPKILEKEKIDAIGHPQISITKLARKNPLGFKIKTAIMPEMQIPDYKQIAKKVLSEMKDEEKNVNVTEKEVEDTIMDIRKSRAPKIHIKEGVELTEKDSQPATLTEELPEFNDTFVQALGPFKDIKDFKEKLKENIKLEKENQAKEKTRLKIIEKIIDDLKVDIPEILIGVELDKILYRMESDISQMGLKFGDYLKHLNKTVEDLRKEFRVDAEKKAKFALILNKIAELEKIVADPEQVALEIAKILEHYKDADPERAKFHVENVLTNEKVFQFLENQK
ncbi:MAG: Trigger factor [Candidatus Nomurabacteria bacterium GW2011_GWF2_35_12]|uniref:Trigger factor n=3 Tax=Candidatus Nomuraibacteriota TaxID=1752729 RepID=A0A0G0E9H1_9BACT|nr:MAG: Trigger factor [Candidatus Nomurabacteria bacterium GW2011_GWF2_35_12]KKP71622.1 MAG: Trigger factor [Candidatus Nomurabacteria bacterium GW2011_GWB1_35_20]KKP75490.1 MAG: Trigger factor [Parcubacteria group bacterium GW2011_GWC1_35_21]KKP78070.1 MAG: Trigger factor [Candidatus Nomurabacteria bacterium GW2011_GWC2_35_35]KKP87742.1 MAG: Trigger factor [Candidatus Nomurabacteria bacterium GW2011_GWA2_35_80]KKP97746.1 MAG: Trigger factor [Candidatus Nomurabacteria bacterium GW2011_GWA1_36